MSQDPTNNATIDASTASDRWKDRGASLVEYALLLALIAVVCVSAVGLLGQTVSERVEGDAQQLYDAGR